MSLAEALSGDLAAGTISAENLQLAASVATGQHIESHMRTLLWSCSEMLRRQELLHFARIFRRTLLKPKVHTPAFLFFVPWDFLR